MFSASDENVRELLIDKPCETLYYFILVFEEYKNEWKSLRPHSFICSLERLYTISKINDDLNQSVPLHVVNGRYVFKIIDSSNH